MSLAIPKSDQTATRVAASASALMVLSAAISAYWTALRRTQGSGPGAQAGR